jgi:hypothetical protein
MIRKAAVECVEASPSSIRITESIGIRSSAGAVLSAADDSNPN